MPASDGCFRFMVDVERLSTKREEERQTREAGFTLEVGQSGRAFGCTHTHSTRFCKILIPLNVQWVVCCFINTPKIIIKTIYTNIPINPLL